MYHRPQHLDDALELLAHRTLTPLAGGTDYYPARVGQPPRDEVLDVTAIEGLRAIEVDAQRIRFGAAVTWTDLLRTQLPPECRAYAQAAREVGGVQIQNAGTLVGNLCNASPAADGTPNLLALDAEVELASRGGRRTLPVAAFVRGNRETARREDELVVALSMARPAVPAGGRCASAFFKLGARRYLVISIVMVSVVLVADAAGAVGDARIAVGACSVVPQRLAALEQRLLGLPFDAAVLADAVGADDLQALTPIDDVRATASYRVDAALTCVRRAIGDAATDLRREAA